MYKKILILILLIFLISLTAVSAQSNDTVISENIDNETSLNIENTDEEVEQIGISENDNETLSISEETVLGSSASSVSDSPKKTSSAKSTHYVKYLKVGKYKVKVWSDDSVKVQKQKVLKKLKKKIKKPHTFKIHGYKFKVSAKKYIKILYHKKFKLDTVMFKSKTNKYKTVKIPIYKTKKVKKSKWKYKKVLSYESFYYDDGTYDSYSYDLTKYYDKGWELYGWYDKDFVDGYESYAKLKKKVKYTAKKKVIVGYQKIKCPVYAFGVGTYFVPHVTFRAMHNGEIVDLASGGDYFPL